MGKSRKYELGVGCLLVVALVVLAYMALQVGTLGSLGRQLHVTVRFPDASGLAEGAMVWVAGVEVGTVDYLEVDHDEAVVGLSLDGSAGLRQDVRARIRSRSLLGEKYVSLTPQSRDAPLLADGDELVPGPPKTEIDDVVDALGPFLGSVDSEALSRSMAVLAQALEEDPQRVGRMLANADTILENAAVASEGLPELVDQGSATFRDARTTLHGIDERVSEAEPVIAHADEILVDVGEVTADLPELVAEIEGLVGEAREVTVRIDETTGDLQVVMANLSEIDKWELRRLIREEGVLLRFRPREVDPESDEAFRRKGRVE